MKALLVIFSLFLSTSAFAGGVEKFTQAKFEQLQKSDATFLIDVFATWCPTCKKQAMVIDKYLDQNPGKNFTVLKVDYDDQKKWVKYFKAPRQSTLVMYKGDKEIARSIAQTNEKKLFSLFSTTAPMTK